MKNKRWTTEEDELVAQVVKENFDNLQGAFRELAKQLDRTYMAVSNRWYKALSNPESEHYVGSPCFIGFGARKYHSNRKTYIEGYSKQTPKETSLSIWSKIIKFLGF